MTPLFSVAANIIGPIFLIVGLAILLDRRFALNPQVLSRVIIYLFSPFLVLDGIARSDLQADEMGLIVAMAILSILSVTLVGWGLARLCGFDRKLESAFLLGVALINAGNYGLPLCEFAFGKAGLQRAVIFYVVTAVVANTLGVYLASRGAASVRRSLLNMLTVPLPYATALGIIFNVGHVALPLPVDRAITLLSQATVPCMLVLLGLQLSRTSAKGRLGPIALVTVTRLVIAPLIAFPLAALLGLSGVTRQVSIVEASMPTAVMSGVLATEFGGDAEFATATVLVSTLASIITLSILLSLVM